ncbi:class I SAM-dependent methyltransferase [Christensenellaceae bacterium OttesenSCG-928-L17]|nr:class I SAM-dependent methyltransferase [Christensenellaceae bacterium OttesenSCG-928-L17]
MDKTAMVVNSYDGCAENYAARFMEFSLYNDLFNAFAALLKNCAEVVDIACGPGNVARYMLQQNPTFRWTGVDLSGEMIRLAKEHVPGGTFDVRDIRALDFQENSFDAGMAAFCLPHLTNEEALAFLADFAKLLRPGAYAYVSTMEGAGSKTADASFSDGREFYYNFYSRAFLEEAFRACNFQIVRAAEKEYLEPDGSVTTDLVYFLQATK